MVYKNAIRRMWKGGDGEIVQRAQFRDFTCSAATTMLVVVRPARVRWSQRMRSDHQTALLIAKAFVMQECDGTYHAVRVELHAPPSHVGGLHGSVPVDSRRSWWSLLYYDRFQELTVLCDLQCG